MVMHSCTRFVRRRLVLNCLQALLTVAAIGTRGLKDIASMPTEASERALGKRRTRAILLVRRRSGGEGGPDRSDGPSAARAIRRRVRWTCSRRHCNRFC